MENRAILKYVKCLLGGGLIAFLFLLCGCSPVRDSNPAPDSISGKVMGSDGPISGAVVRVKASEIETRTDTHGRFTLTGLAGDNPVFVTAWSPGFYIGGAEQNYSPGTDGVEITLTKHSEVDNPDYQWLSAFTAAGYIGSGEDGNCQNCHEDPDDPTAVLPFTEWATDAHALSAQNPRFLSMYNGTDLAGNQSPPTEYIYNQESKPPMPLPPNLDQPYYGPGFRLDFPDDAGNCAACHAAAAAIDAPNSTDMNAIADVGSEGITCDFCHKVWDVILRDSGLPPARQPGVMSFEFRRPEEGHQFFAGPLDDVAPGEDTYSPVQQQSDYCAPCHVGVFWDITIYNSFGEWLKSPYSDPETGRTCQNCHMPVGLTDHFARLDRGAVIRDPNTIFSHRMLGAMDEEFLQNAMSVQVATETMADSVQVDVSILNDNTGHHIPTDSPLRQLILVVQAFDDQGEALLLADGPTLPDWTGVGDPTSGHYAGLPGEAYAKILQDRWLGVAPTGSYWNPINVMQDNRIPALEEAVSHYTFSIPEAGQKTITIRVRVIYRRAFIQLMEWKQWNTPDIVIYEESFEVVEKF